MSSTSLIHPGSPFACNAHAADIRDQMDVQTGKAELVIPDMSPQKVVAQVKDALSQWSIPANRKLPAPPVKNAFVYIAEGIQAWVFPFQKGVKVYLLHTRVKKTESLTAGLFNGIAKTIQGTDDEWMTKQLNENIAAIRKNIPSLLVEKIEVPGAAVLEPDRAAVAALIPAKSDLPPAVAVQPLARVAAAAVAQTPMQASISPTAQSEVAKIMATIPADATPDQRETVRARLLSVHASLRKFTDRIDPETGNLR